jgi:hypothetical protein
VRVIKVTNSEDIINGMVHENEIPQAFVMLANTMRTIYQSHEDMPAQVAGDSAIWLSIAQGALANLVKVNCPDHFNALVAMAEAGYQDQVEAWMAKWINPDSTAEGFGELAGIVACSSALSRLLPIITAAMAIRFEQIGLGK